MSTITKPKKLVDVEVKLSELNQLCSDKKKELKEITSTIESMKEEWTRLNKEKALFLSNHEKERQGLTGNIESIKQELATLLDKRGDILVEIDNLHSLKSKVLLEIEQGTSDISTNKATLDEMATQHNEYIVKLNSIQKKIEQENSVLSEIKKQARIEQSKIEGRSIDIMQREISVAGREQQVAIRENEIAEEMSKLSADRKSVDEIMARIKQREESLKGLEMLESNSKSILMSKQEEYDRRLDNLSTLEEQYLEREQSLKDREAEYMLKLAEITNRERIVRVREKSLHIND